MYQPPAVDDGAERPAGAAGPPTMEHDLDAIQPTSMSRAGGGALAVTGGFTVVLSLQTWLLIVRVPLVVQLLAIMMTLLGPAQVYLGWKVTRLHGWAATAGAAVAGVGALVSLVWALYAFLHGVLSLLSVFLVPVSIVAAILTGVCIRQGRIADAARARLAEHGMEVGT